jgi:hypothetical protein
MRKVFAAAALSAVAILWVAAASGAAAKGPAKVPGKVSVSATPTNTTDSKGASHTTSVEVSGKVKTTAACRAGRTITFVFVLPSGSYPVFPAGSYTQLSVKTNRKGAFTASLPFTPTGLTSKSQGTNASVSATASRVSRKDKATGEKVKCQQASGLGDFIVTV